MRTTGMVALGLAVLAGCSQGGAGDASSPTSVTAAASATTSTTPPVSIPAEIRQFRASREFESVAAPVAIRIPAIGVESSLEELGLAADGTIEVPSWERAGWFTGGPKPGQSGPAVILGHVDAPRGGAVFSQLDRLRPGHEVFVDRADGTTVLFHVERSEQHPKDRFPTEAVYGPTLDTGLRLVTCGGSFDRSVGHYRDNVIVFATVA